MMRRWVGAVLFVLATSLAADILAQERIEYRVSPGDSIRITIFQNPNMTLEARVAEDGTIAYPLIGRIQIGGMTLPSAESAIAKALEAGKFLNRPQVSIVPLLIIGNQVSVLGLVNRPGRFPLEGSTTRISEVIAIAGGISAAGADTAIVRGTRSGKPYQTEIDIAALFLSKDDNDVVVRPGDVIYVHRAPMFYVYGEVQKPGSYRVERGMTMRQALVQGGGLTSRGTERGVRLHRRSAAGELQVLRPALDDLVRSDDVLYVGESIF